MSIAIEYPESKLHAGAKFHIFQSITATAANAINSSTSSSVSSGCGSGSSTNIINTNCNINSSQSTKFIDIAMFLNCIAKTIILDCRVLKDYESKHIKNSVHINCRDKITKKRLSTKKLSVKDIIGCEETKKKLESYCGLSAATTCSREAAENESLIAPPTENDNLIVIYDDSTSDDNDLFLETNPLQIVLDNIKHTFKHNNCKILKGGFKEFAKAWPSYCVQKEKVPICQPINNAYENSEESFRYAIDNAKITKIKDYLYLGNECDAKNEKLLCELGITHVINVTKNIPLYHENNCSFKYKRIPVNDACNQNLKQFFEETNKFIDEARNSKAKVLVHCQAGISRSPTIVIAYIMKTYNKSMNDAYNEVKNERPIIGPNIIFLSQLYDYENNLKIDEDKMIHSNNNNNNNGENLVITKCTATTATTLSSRSSFSFFGFTRNDNTNNNNNNNTIATNNVAQIGMPLGLLSHIPMV